MVILYCQVEVKFPVNWLSYTYSRFIECPSNFRIALYIGWFSCGGFSIASCFPLTSIAAEDVHFVGALTGCGFGIIYLLLQVRIKNYLTYTDIAPNLGGLYKGRPPFFGLF